MSSAVVLARASIARHSKSFSLAARLLPLEARDTARVVYAWCRRADDAVDQAPPHEQRDALGELDDELDAIYGTTGPVDPIAAAFQQVVRSTNIPRRYPSELLLGMRMDVEGHLYSTWDDLLLYCFRAAGTVGLMMCHVLSVSDAPALRHAAHLGIAMQLTNIARDVLEDWQRGRLYLPDSLLAEYGAGGLLGYLGRPFPRAASPAVALASRELLREADRYYRSGDEGLRFLDPRSAWAVRTARLVYADIGRQLARKKHDPLAGRAYVSTPRKLLLAARAAAWTGFALPQRWRHPSAPVSLPPPLSFPHDILPV